MSSPREAIDYLRDILDAAESAVQFVAGAVPVNDSLAFRVEP